MKASGASVGLSSISGLAAADDSNQDGDKDKLELNDKTVISDDEDNTIVGVDITKSSSDDTEESHSNRKRFIATVEKESGSVSMSEVASQQYSSRTSDNEMAVANARVTPADDNDIVVRSDLYEHDRDKCDVYGYHTHLWAATTAEFTDEVGDLGWGTVSAALISLISSSALSGGATALLTAAVTAVGGLAAIVTDTYEITFGVAEWDQSVIIGDLEMYSVRAAPDYHKDEGELTTLAPIEGHPSR